MPRKHRREAIKLELARRERESGVPPHLHVYHLTRHHADEGGPRSFYPLRCFQELQSRQDAADCDDIDDEVLLLGSDLPAAPVNRVDRGPSVIRQLLDAALQRGEPIELIAERAECFKASAPFADYCEFGSLSLNEEVMILSRRAASALGELLATCCQEVAVTCAGHDLVGYQLRAVEDVLDVANTEAYWRDPRDRTSASRITRYAIFTERLGRSMMFTLPQICYEKLVLQPFVDRVRSNNLNGFKFKKVWPAMGVDQWV